ncbi:MAG: hypothetical protein OEX19_04015 [Gammaproteobacteria bacterium]|nr:hypothetical protein [Gammaproteobacteria bacterium]
MNLKIKYTYGIPEKPETNFSKKFSIEEVENGYPIDEISDSPLLREYVILSREVVHVDGE